MAEAEREIAPGEALLARFARIAVINLPERTDRLAEMAAQLDRLGIGFETPGVALFEAVRPAEAAPFPSVGARGCFLSHREVLAAAEAEGVASVLILEDDLDFAACVERLLPSALAALDAATWDIFYGGYGNPLDAGRTGPLIEVPPGQGVSATHMVGFRGEAIGEARAFLDTLLSRAPGDPRGGPMHVDGAYCWYRRTHPDRVTRAAVPPLGGQRASRSDVYDANPWYDRVPALGPAVALARRARRLFRAG